MRGFFAALRMTRVRGGLEENKQLQKQKQMRGFFASLRMTSFRGGFGGEQATAKAKTNAGVLRFAQNDKG